MKKNDPFKKKINFVCIFTNVNMSKPIKKYKYKAFGLSIESEIFFPELILTDDKPDVYIKYGSIPKRLENPKKTGIKFQASENELLLNVDNVAGYYIQNGNSITINKYNNKDENSIRLFLLGSAFGALLIQRDVFSLHGSSTVIDGKAVVFSGVSGTGKSSLVTEFYNDDYLFLNDDVSSILFNGGELFVVSAYPRIKLWKDTVDQFSLNENNFDKIRKNIQKFGVPTKEKYCNTQPPLEAIFILGTKNTEGIDVREIKGIEKFNILKRNTYRFQFINGLNKQKEHFKAFNELALKIPVYKLDRPKKGFYTKEMKTEIMKIIDNNGI